MSRKDVLLRRTNIKKKKKKIVLNRFYCSFAARSTAKPVLKPTLSEVTSALLELSMYRGSFINANLVILEPQSRIISV